MKEVGKLWKCIKWVVIFYIFSSILIYIGLNASYKNIDDKEKLPNQVKINLAQATSVNGRIYGEVTSTEENNLNGKYIKVQIFKKGSDLVGTKYLKIENTQINEPKKFAVTFKAEHIESYKLSIIDNSEEVEEQVKKESELYNGIFTEKDLKIYTILLLVLGFSVA